MNKSASVHLWGRTIGAVTWVDDRETGVFQYAPDFLNSGIELSPLHMPLKEFPYEFPALSRQTFKGLPGLLADSLPDRFGNAVIDTWLAAQGRTAESFNPVERLCYIGNRGMGALEFKPALLGPPTDDANIEVEELVKLANRILDDRLALAGVLNGDDDRDAIEQIIRVGTSAGGARAKAILAWNPETREFRSGHIDAAEGFEYWIMKFDGISSNRDKELADPQGYGKIEFAYHLMAREIGIEMMPCRLHHEGPRSHFMTRRFDRTADGSKLHMQSLAAIAHYDFHRPDLYSYEQAIQVMKRLGLPSQDLRQQVLRAFFNVVGRNHDDHVKNIAFLMDQSGNWRLSPAFDLIYAFNPDGAWTSRHQMSINGKRDRFARQDLILLAEQGGIKKASAQDMIDRVINIFKDWPDFAKKAGVEGSQVDAIRNTLRTDI